MSIKAFDTAVSGMRLASTKLAASAHNVANLVTEDFARTQASGVEAKDGGVNVELSTASAPGPDLVADVIEQKVAAVVYRANLQVVKTTDALLGDLLNTRG